MKNDYNIKEEDAILCRGNDTGSHCHIRRWRGWGKCPAHRQAQHYQMDIAKMGAIIDGGAPAQQLHPVPRRGPIEGTHGWMIVVTIATVRVLLQERPTVLARRSKSIAPIRFFLLRSLRPFTYFFIVSEHAARLS